MKSIKTVGIILLCLPAFCIAQGQKVYIQKGPDGQTIFTDRPSPADQTVDTLEMPSAPAPQSSQDTQREQEMQERARTVTERTNARRAAQQRVDEARRELAAAEQAQRDGKKPIPGERDGKVYVIREPGFNNVANEKYFERQRKLQDRVDAARENLVKAQRELTNVP